MVKLQNSSFSFQKSLIRKCHYSSVIKITPKALFLKSRYFHQRKKFLFGNKLLKLKKPFCFLMIELQNGFFSFQNFSENY